MTAATMSHVASPRGCDTRQTASPNATAGATPCATTDRNAPSVLDLARDTLMRLGRDKESKKRATALRQAIDRCCDTRGDDDANRVALHRECIDLTPGGQADMTEHFQQEAVRFERSKR